MDSANSKLEGSNHDSPARERLIALRLALLRVHKKLLEMERRNYERDHGHVNAGELFRLVVDHSQFAWLHNISEFVVRIDESLAAEEPITPEYTKIAFSLARKMFVPTESGDGLQTPSRTTRPWSSSMQSWPASSTTSRRTPRAPSRWRIADRILPSGGSWREARNPPEARCVWS